MTEDGEELETKTAASVRLTKRESRDPSGSLKDRTESRWPQFSCEADRGLHLTL
jgi:hypothetical protein